MPVKALYPPKIPCAGVPFCVPLQDCPPGATVTVVIAENPQGLAPPQFLGYADGVANFIAAQAGDFAIDFICCPPEEPEN